MSANAELAQLATQIAFLISARSCEEDGTQHATECNYFVLEAVTEARKLSKKNELLPSTTWPPTEHPPVNNTNSQSGLSTENPHSSPSLIQSVPVQAVRAVARLARSGMWGAKSGEAGGRRESGKRTGERKRAKSGRPEAARPEPKDALLNSRLAQSPRRAKGSEGHNPVCALGARIGM
jgi:hypothetical protein